jgi:hypothetical protein
VTTTLSIAMLPVRDQAALFSIYPNQDAPQACFIALNLSTGRMSAQTNPEIGNAVPLDVWHGIERRYGLPGPMLASAANALMEDIASPAQIILTHAEVAWDGSNNVVRTHERNCEDEWQCDCPVAVAERAIEGAINGMPAEDTVWLSWAEAGDWYTEGVSEYVARVQAGEDIDAVANFMEQEIENYYRGDGEWWVVEGIHAYLARAVEQAKAEEVN